MDKDIYSDIDRDIEKKRRRQEDRYIESMKHRSNERKDWKKRERKIYIWMVKGKRVVEKTR